MGISIQKQHGENSSFCRKVQNSLQISNVSIDLEMTNIIVNALISNKTKSMSLISCRIGEKEIELISRAIQKNESLREVSISISIRNFSIGQKQKLAELEDILMHKPLTVKQVNLLQ
jgi:hypothetical protein